jgi:hypothetical protein
MMNFFLRGYDSPTGSYPSPVAPVGEGESGLVVVYRSGDTLEVESIGAEAQFVRHVVDDFCVEQDALFAFSEEDVVRYAFEDEALFFEAVLQDSRMTEVDAFFRLAIAMETGHADLISHELAVARSKMFENAPYYATSWYASTLERLGEGWRNDSGSLMVLEHAGWPAASRSILAPVFFAERQFGRAVSRLRDVLDRSSGNGARDTLAKLGAHSAADVTIAVSGQQMAEVGAYINVPGTRIWWEDTPAVEMVDLVIVAEPSDAGLTPSDDVYHITHPLLDVPMLSAHDLSWTARVESGLASFEERVAEAVRNLVRVPRLRAGVRQAAEIGAAHVKNLEMQHEVLREQMIVAEERAQAFFGTERYVRESIHRFAEHCLRMVREEIAAWRPPGLLSTTATKKREVSALARRCGALVEDEFRTWRRSVTREWGDLFESRGVGIESNFLEEAFVPVVSMTAALTALPLSAVLTRGFNGEFVKRVLADVARNEIRTMVESMEELVRDARARMRVEVERIVNEPADRRRQNDELIEETVRCMQRLRRIDYCLDIGAVM